MKNQIIEEPKDQKLTFEVALEKLQVAVKRLESGELSLEDALKQFEEGVKLTRTCQQYLSAAENKIEILTKGSTTDSVQLQNFS